MTLLLVCAVPALTDTLHAPFRGRLLAQLTMCFPHDDWRREAGLPDLFPSDDNCETHSFWEGTVVAGARPVAKSADVGPYAGTDDWVNAVMLEENAGDRFSLVPADSGLFVWLTAYGLASHERRYDTRCTFTLVLYAPRWPASGHALVYYVENYRDGAAHAFKSRAAQVELAGERLLVRGYADPYLEVPKTDMRVHFEGAVTWSDAAIFR